jgi:lipopolysaccharide transport system ATP-binding protein
MSDTIIKVEGVGKKYVIAHEGREPYVALRDVISRKAKKMVAGSSAPAKSKEEFWALNDVSFEVKKGDVVGIVGRNGAGKSTLLKILSRITEPTSGRIELNGRLASLLEVGTGFHPELTGRENIFLNGAILGMSQVEIRKKFDEIVDFSGVEKFLDTPVKRYSSGMYVRLAFAVAAHLEPEILVIDEVLAVGDAEFQKKCLGKMNDVSKNEGRTVLFVSHNMGSVEFLCNKGILLKNGQIEAQGNADEIVALYNKSDSINTAEWTAPRNNVTKSPYFEPLRMAVVDQNLQPLDKAMKVSDSIGVIVEGNIEIFDYSFSIGFAVYSQSNELLLWTLHHDLEEEKWPKLKTGYNKLLCWLPAAYFNEGDYRIELMTSLHHQRWFSQPGVNAPTVFFTLQGGLSNSPFWQIPRPGLLAPQLPFFQI